MIEVIVAVVAGVFAILLELLRRSSNKREKQQQQLLDEIKELKTQVNDLQDSLDEWKSKYYLLLMEMTNNA
ncbi:hypothetical protein [Rhodococcus opacus]|uniref:hypothetical protein n=1 Tax=Rhodococcus opacus TaxID=37919 RepID=UPI000ACC85BB|nr:hypothetical protein [Rhodococcus opacus]